MPRKLFLDRVHVRSLTSRSKPIGPHKNKRSPQSKTDMKTTNTTTDKVLSSGLEGHKDSFMSSNDSSRSSKEKLNAKQPYVSPAQLAKYIYFA